MSASTIHIRRFVAVDGEGTESERESAAAVSAETIAYWAVVAAIYCGFGFLWYYSATFAALIFGRQMVSEFDSVAQLFGYFGATVVTLLLVQILPPRRGVWRAGAE